MHPHPINYSKQNQGYYVFIHEDNSPQDTDPDHSLSATTDGLEWDEEPIEESFSSAEDDTWSSLYKWYAQMLAHSDSAVGNSNGAFKKIINQVGIKKRGAAHYAAEQGHTGVLQLLLQTDCPIDTYDADGLTPLHLAVCNGRTGATKLLLEAAANPNRSTLNSDQYTCLHLAAKNGNPQIIEILVSAGVGLEIRDKDEQTPLHHAIKEQMTEAANKLIELGCNINVEDINGITPLCLAIWQNSADLVDSLLCAGARVPPHHYLLHHSVFTKQTDIVKLLVKHGSNINLRNSDGDTALLLAVRSGYSQIVQILLENGASVDYPNSLTGSTALHEAVVCSEDYLTFNEIFTYLQQYDVNINEICFSGGDTPLFRAILLGRDKAAKLLIRNGANVNLCSLQHCVDNLSLAMARNSMSVARLLVLAGAQPPKEWGNNPRPLTHLVRLVLRNSFSPISLKKSIQLLPLPKLLKSFLMFENEEETD